MPQPRKQTGTTASGRNRPKVKSGCRTCKIRKVKCDEGRPACNRCVSTGRKCDGYGIWETQSRLNTTLASNDSVTDIKAKVAIPRKAAKASDQIDCSVVSWNSKSCPQTFETDYDISHSQITISRLKQESALTSIPTPLLIFSLAPQERGLLSWFQECTATKLGGLFPSSFWNSLLLQASHTEPAILHALLALTSAHKYEKNTTAFKQRSAGEQFTLQSYTKAIHHLRPHFSLQNQASLRVTLLTCILFVCLEIIQRHYASAISHLRNGQKLIQQAAQTQHLHGTKSFPGDEDSDHLLNQMFLELSIQVKMLGPNPNTSRLYLPSTINNHNNTPTLLPNKFSSTRTARNHLDELFTRALNLRDLCLEYHKGIHYPNQDLPPVVFTQQATLQLDLATWLQSFHASSLNTSTTPTSPWRTAACHILQMYHTLLLIITATATYPTNETIFDTHTPSFKAILSHANAAQSITNAVHHPGSHQHNDMTETDIRTPSLPATPGSQNSTILSSAWIPPLFYAATKCRVHTIRRHAIHLLEQTTHREGVWDAGAAAKVAGEVVRMEKEGGGVGSSPVFKGFYGGWEWMNDGGGEFNDEVIPDEQRLHAVTLLPPSDADSKLAFTYRRRCGDGTWQDVRREYDGVTGTWSDVHVQCLM